MGRLVKNRGKSAQCMAHANEAVIPNVSKFIFLFIIKDRKDKDLQQSCRIQIVILNKALTAANVTLRFKERS